jgi:hypothetical protein
MSEIAKQVEMDELMQNLSTKDRLLQLDAFLIHSPQEHLHMEV